MQFLYPSAYKTKYNISYLTLKLRNHNHDYLLCSSLRTRIKKKKSHSLILKDLFKLIVFLQGCLRVFLQLKIKKEDKPASSRYTLLLP